MFGTVSSLKSNCWRRRQTAAADVLPLYLMTDFVGSGAAADFRGVTTATRDFLEEPLASSGTVLRLTGFDAVLEAEGPVIGKALLVPAAGAGFEQPKVLATGCALLGPAAATVFVVVALCGAKAGRGGGPAVRMPVATGFLCGVAAAAAGSRCRGAAAPAAPAADVEGVGAVRSAEREVKRRERQTKS